MKMNNIFVGAALVFIAFGTAPDLHRPAGPPPVRMTDYGRLPLSFEVNEGQTNSAVKFLSRGAGYRLFLTTDEAVLVLATPPGRATATVVRLQLAGANAAATVTGFGKRTGHSNYLIGSDPSKWRRHVANYASVRYGQIYPGVDLVYYGNERRLEHDFVVAPGADPRVIALKFEGAADETITADGDLVLGVERGEIRLRKPRIYQDVGSVRREVAGRYAFTGPHAVGFIVADYDRTRPLVIDPVLEYSTYLGGTGGEAGYGIAVDAAGQAYVTGITGSAAFPTAGPYQGSLNGADDIYVAKLNADGSALMYSTYLGGSGGSGTEGSHFSAIAVDDFGSAYVTGYAPSCNFPTMNPIQLCNAGDFGSGDAFVAKLNAGGDDLVYSTFLGGGSSDWGAAIVVDAAGRAYVTGATNVGGFNPDFSPKTVYPTTANAYQHTSNDGYTAFVTVVSADGSALDYSTLFSGSWEEGVSVGADGFGAAYLAVAAQVGGFPDHTIVAKFDTSPAACSPGPPGSLVNCQESLVYSASIAGTAPGGLAVDGSGNAFVTGQAFPAFVATAGAFQTTCGDIDCADAFVTKLDAGSAAILYATRLGGSHGDTGQGVAVDGVGNAYVTGTTCSEDFPSVNALPQPHTFPCNSANSFAYVTKLNAAGSALVYSTLLTGGRDEGRSIAVDTAGSAYVTGTTFSQLFPTTAGAFQPAKASPSGDGEAFVAKISDAPDVVDGIAPTTTATPSGTAGNDGWWRSNVTVDFSATDEAGGSGAKEIDYSATGAQPIAPTSASGASASVLVVAAGSTVLTFSATDNANNTEASQNLTIKIDKLAPLVSIAAPASTAYLLNQIVLANYTCTDGGSGIATCSGPVASGSPIATAAVGGQAFAVNATDVAGNGAGPFSVSYDVTYKIFLLYDSSKAFAGHAKPQIDVQLQDANGVNRSAQAVGVTAVRVSPRGGTSVVKALSGNFAFDSHLKAKGSAAGGGYGYALDAKGIAPGLYDLVFSVAGDPVLHAASFQIK